MALGGNAGALEVLRLGNQFDAAMSTHVAAANARMEQLIGATNYTAADEVDTSVLTATQITTAHLACNLLAAAEFLENHSLVGSDRGVLSSATRESGATESFVFPGDVTKACQRYRDRAIWQLRDVGLWQRPATAEGTRVVVDEDDA